MTKVHNIEGTPVDLQGSLLPIPDWAKPIKEKAIEYLRSIDGGQSVALQSVNYSVHPETQALECYAIKSAPTESPRLVYVAYLNTTAPGQSNCIVTIHHHFNFPTNEQQKSS